MLGHCLYSQRKPKACLVNDFVNISYSSGAESAYLHMYIAWKNCPVKTGNLARVPLSTYKQTLGIGVGEYRPPTLIFILSILTLSSKKGPFGQNVALSRARYLVNNGLSIRQPPKLLAFLSR